MAARALTAALVVLCVAVARGGGPCPACPACTACPAGLPSCAPLPALDNDECNYIIRDEGERGERLMLEVHESFYSVECEGARTLDARALPAPVAPLRVPAVYVKRCAPPARGYGAALRALGAAPLRSLQLQRLPAARLTRAHFAHLPPLEKLVVQGNRDANVTAEDDFLGELSALRELTVWGVSLTPPALSLLPAALVELDVSGAGTGCAGCYAAALRRLPRLRVLRVTDNQLHAAPALAAAPELRVAIITAPLREPLSLDDSGVVNVTLATAETASVAGCPALLRLWLVRVRAVRPLRCARLRLLSLAQSPRLAALPPALLRGAPALRSFALKMCAALTTLPPRLFADAVNLTSADLSFNGLVELPEDLFGDPYPSIRRMQLRNLSLRNNSLRALPATMFAALPELRYLDLSRNRLRALPSGVFTGLERLQWLDVSRNQLRAPLALAGLRALPQLGRLVLSHNPLGDLCPLAHNTTIVPETEPEDPLQDMGSLEVLELAGVGGTRLCGGWRRLRALRRLDFGGNALRALRRDDLLWPHARLRLDLRGNPLRALQLGPADRFDVVDEPTVKILMDSVLTCDCRTYWVARAVRARRLPAELREPRCDTAAGPVPLLDLPPDQMVCALDAAAGCPAGCACALRPHDNSTAVRCAALPAAPPLSAHLARAARTRLLLPNNNLTRLPPPHALPHNLYEIDLRNNSLTGSEAGDAEAMAAILQRASVVWLSGNPLRCACEDALMRAPPAAVRDYAALRCADGRSLAAAVQRCPSAPRSSLWPLAAGVALLPVLFLARVAWRWLRRLLSARGGRDEDRNCKYDVFLSYAHPDHAAAEAVRARLEAGGLRLCVHERDWRPGGWIPAQIAASVRASRRTLALLSAAYARSRWARAELRLAAAHALRRPPPPRLLVVLLDPCPPRLDPELQRYVSHNTYLKRSDPAFWDKLLRALPPPRPAPPAAPSPPRPPAAARPPAAPRHPKAAEAVRAILAAPPGIRAPPCPA